MEAWRRKRQHEALDDYEPPDPEIEVIWRGWWELQTERTLVGTFAGIYHGSIPVSKLDDWLKRNGYPLRDWPAPLFRHCWAALETVWHRHLNRNLKTKESS